MCWKPCKKKYQQQFWFNCGLLQLTDKNRMLEIINKFNFNEDYVSLSRELAEITDEKGVEKAYAEYKSAGVVLPRVLCDVLRQECGDKLDFIQAEVSDIKQLNAQ